ncbi:thioesterase family protein [Fictibacillus macauensis ZFHKF-1]|uniref:Thioesterase family protein n=1 Tax=Fictibacillus macauensis ZFHKF-1 TaxID=1196324 RepID=I8ALR0_9BACL|nr:thioesterase family protein [Fictibacillus macauensis]EIT86862.1 thioesterase family protein [Fictibacillus macauensis ZFHKF-1]
MLLSKTTVDVRYAETDQMGVVYHANYLVWFEIGRTVYIEDLGFQYAQMEQDGVLSPVTEAHVHYKKPLRYPDRATISTWVAAYNGVKVHYHYEIHNEKGELCLTGSTVHVCVDKDTFRPLSLKKHFPQWHAAYEQHKKQEC